jgi:hypothetical protein
MKEIPKVQVNCLSDDSLFEEVAQRLRCIYQREHGLPFLYGSFDFVIHQGRFQSIEERPKNKRYVSHPICTRLGEKP